MGEGHEWGWGEDKESRWSEVSQPQLHWLTYPFCGGTCPVHWQIFSNIPGLSLPWLLVVPHSASL